MHSDLDGLVSRGGVVVLSGAGPSTESGIPDYRGPTGAAKLRVPVVIVNQGPTRGDALAALKLEAPLGEVLTRLVAGCGDRFVPEELTPDGRCTLTP